MNHPGSLRDQDVTSSTWSFQASALSGRHICFSWRRKQSQNRRVGWQHHKVKPCPLLPGFLHWSGTIYEKCLGAIVHSAKRTKIGTTTIHSFFHNPWNGTGLISSFVLDTREKCHSHRIIFLYKMNWHGFFHKVYLLIRILTVYLDGCICKCSKLLHYCLQRVRLLFISQHGRCTSCTFHLRGTAQGWWSLWINTSFWKPQKLTDSKACMCSNSLHSHLAQVPHLTEDASAL